MIQAAERYVVSVRLAHSDESTLLALVSTLHRRGVNVSAAELLATAHGGPMFHATFHASQRQAATVAASLRNLVNVLDADLSATA